MSEMVGIFRNSDMAWIANIPANEINAVARMSRDGAGYTIGPAMKRALCECRCGFQHQRVIEMEVEIDDE